MRSIDSDARVHAPWAKWIAVKLHIEAVLFLLTLFGRILQKVMMPPSTTLLDTTSSSSSSMVADADESLFTTTTKFPVKLHQLLEAAESDPWLSSIISWVCDGRGFLIHNQNIFDRKVMPEIFPTMRAFSSFRRQLNLYGIKKSSLGAPYEHPLLRRARQDLVVEMKRPSSKAITAMLRHHGQKVVVVTTTSSTTTANDLAAQEAMTSSSLSCVPATNKCGDSLLKLYDNTVEWFLDIPPSQLLSHHKKQQEDGKDITKSYKKVKPPPPLLHDNKILDSMLTTTLRLDNNACPKELASLKPNSSCSPSQWKPMEISFSAAVRAAAQLQEQQQATAGGIRRDNFEPTRISITSHFPSDLTFLPHTTSDGSNNEVLDMDDIQQEIINTFSSFWRKPHEG